MTGKRDANTVRDPERFIELVDWSSVPGAGLTGTVSLTGVEDREAALAAAASLSARRGAEGEAAFGDDVSTPEREAAFDAALERVNASDLMERARERRRERLRAGGPRVRHEPETAAAKRKAETKAQRKAARQAEARTSHAPQKARAAAFSNLVQRGCLPELCVRAGLDIDRIMTAVEAGVFAASDPDTLMTGGVKVSGRRGAPQFMAVEGYCDRYLPWTRRLLEPEYRRAGLPGRAVLAVVVAVVKDGRAPRDLDKAIGVRNSTCMGLLCDGLREYGRLAGWTSGKEGG